MENWCNLQKEDLDGEIWKTITWATNYKISNKGRIKVLEHKKGSHYKKEDYPIIMKQGLDTKKYCSTSIINNYNKRITIKIHRIVGIFFIENTYNLEQINHIDGVKTNNNIENLEWISNIENMRHSYRIGLRTESSRGENNGRSIVTEKDVIYIYTNPDRKTITELRKQFNLGKTSINSIYSSKNWSYLTKDLEKNMIKSTDKYIKCKKNENILYVKSQVEAIKVSGVKIYALVNSLKHGKVINGWKFEYISYDEYMDGVKNESK